MPRLLPRLLQHIASPPFWHNKRTTLPAVPRRLKRKSLRSPLPPFASFSPSDRSHSILLDEVNPVIHRKKYVRHKSLPPKIRIPRYTVTSETNTEYDRPRRMTVQERTWWSSPYLRMLSSPLRRCFLTNRFLPSDFLIRLAPMRLPSPATSKESTSFLPDGLEHPKFRGRKVGKGHYVVCWNAALEHLVQRGQYKRLAPNLSVHSMLGPQISHLLRVRVLQEFELLGDLLQIRPRTAEDNPVLRRLTRAEFRAIKATGVIPYENAIAILVVPPVNRDPVTKERPDPSPSFPEGPTQVNLLPPSRSPLSSLHPVEEIEPDATFDLPSILAQAQIPLYNGLALFPSRPQRAALHAQLSRLLFIERRARYRVHGRLLHPKGNQAKPRAKGDQKASHGFLLCSDAGTALRADPVGAAIALWRVKMWEGGGWEEGTAEEGGWLWKAYRRKKLGTLGVVF